MLSIPSIIAAARARRCSDVHIVRGMPVQLRIDGSLNPITPAAGVIDPADCTPLTDANCDAYAHELLGDKYDDALRVGEADLATTYGDVRCRINVFRQQNSFSAAIRLLNDTIPVLADLGLPAVVSTFPTYQRGIVIVTGETGSGKSTTLAAILNHINHNRYEHIITLEDPVEYIYKPEKCIINQREVGRDTGSFASGLRASLREDPDVILVGEMRDLETIEIALTAAETGHLVFGTLHTNSAPDSIDRMVDVFPEGRQRQIRMQLSMTLRAVVSQQLLVRREGHGRIAACEIMIVTNAIKNLIREGKTPQIANSMATAASEGSITMDNTLAYMVRNRDISPKAALDACHDADYLSKLIGYR